MVARPEGTVSLRTPLGLCRRGPPIFLPGNCHGAAKRTNIGDGVGAGRAPHFANREGTGTRKATRGTDTRGSEGESRCTREPRGGGKGESGCGPTQDRASPRRPAGRRGRGSAPKPAGAPRGAGSAPGPTSPPPPRTGTAQLLPPPTRGRRGSRLRGSCQGTSASPRPAPRAPRRRLRRPA